MALNELLVLFAGVVVVACACLVGTLALPARLSPREWNMSPPDLTHLLPRLDQVRSNYVAELQLHQTDKVYRETLLAHATDTIRKMSFFARR